MWTLETCGVVESKAGRLTREDCQRTVNDLWVMGATSTVCYVWSPDGELVESHRIDGGEIISEVFDAE